MSHELVTVLVFAYEKGEALEKAKRMLSRECGDIVDGCPWDCWDTFDTPSPLERSGDPEDSAKSRWGKLPVAVGVGTTLGKRVLGSCRIHSEDWHPTLYSENGMNINSPELLQAFLTAGFVKYNCEKQAFLVPADVHT